jgi:hypothetical protein
MIAPAPDAVRVTAISPYRIAVELDDGRRGIFDVEPWLGLPAYAALRDPGYFASVRIEYGVVCWPGDEDFSPEMLAARLVAEIR